MVFRAIYGLIVDCISVTSIRDRLKMNIVEIQKGLTLYREEPSKDCSADSFSGVPSTTDAITVF